MIFNNTTPSEVTMVDSMSYVSTEKGWHTLTLRNPLPVNATRPLWIVFYNDDVDHPACAGVYCGHQHASYASSNLNDMSTTTNNRTFLIRGIFSSPALAVDSFDDGDRDIVFYPVPTTGRLYTDADVESLDVIDVMGRKVLSVGRTKEVDLSPLPNGIYMVRVCLESGDFHLRRVVKH